MQKLFDVNTVTILYLVAFPFFSMDMPGVCMCFFMYFMFRFEVPIKRHALESNQWQGSLQILIGTHTLWNKQKKKCDNLAYGWWCWCDTNMLCTVLFFFVILSLSIYLLLSFTFNSRHRDICKRQVNESVEWTNAHGDGNKTSEMRQMQY